MIIKKNELVKFNFFWKQLTFSKENKEYLSSTGKYNTVERTELDVVRQPVTFQHALGKKRKQKNYIKAIKYLEINKKYQKPVQVKLWTDTKVNLNKWKHISYSWIIQYLKQVSSH